MIGTKKEMILFIITIVSITFLSENVKAGQIKGEGGYYMDLFVDGGKGLQDRCALPALEDLFKQDGLIYECYLGKDKEDQYETLVSNENDLNGCLLYPDGAPRFRAVYVNGGDSEEHAKSLMGGNRSAGHGRDRFYDFFNNGGSYTGSCAGSRIQSLGQDEFFGIWPGKIKRTGISGTGYHHVVKLADNTGFHDYFDLGNIHHVTDGNDGPILYYYIAGVRHNGGNYPDPEHTPGGTEVLATYEKGSSAFSGIRGKPNVWAWKDGSGTGRMVVTGSHPEWPWPDDPDDDTDEKELMKAIFKYALDGVGGPSAKETLMNGAPLIMNSDIEKVGDNQFHYYKIDLPAGKILNNLYIILSENSANNDLYVKRGAYPTLKDADYQSTNNGNNDDFITIHNPSGGVWYIGVHGNHDILNGSAYTIEAVWDKDNISRDKRYAFTMDNENPEPGGKWKISKSRYPFGANSLFSASDGAIYRFVPEAGHRANGRYLVKIHYTEHEHRDSEVPVTVGHAGGTTEMTVDMTGGGGWKEVIMKDFVFDGGDKAYVEIAGDYWKHGPQACVDAVRFEPARDEESSGSSKTRGQTNTPPLAMDQRISMNVNQSATFTLDASDADGDLLAYIFTRPYHGYLIEEKVSQTDVKVVTYIPQKDFVGKDSFTYEVSDGRGATVSATVSITVTGTASEPTPTPIPVPSSSPSPIPIPSPTNTPTVDTVCGDGILSGNEECDGADFNGQDCASLGYGEGVLGCYPSGSTENDACTFDISQCEYCGDGIKNGNEFYCDGTDFGTFSCKTWGYEAGDLVCTDTCRVDKRDCYSICGNGHAGKGEECDGNDLEGETCQSLGYDGGTLACDSDCTFDYFDCYNNAASPSPKPTSTPL